MDYVFLIVFLVSVLQQTLSVRRQSVCAVVPALSVCVCVCESPLKGTHVDSKQRAHFMCH